MFTGIIEEVGQVVDVEQRGDSAVLTLAATKIAEDLRHGGSIAVDGVCLTVIGWVAAQPVDDTLAPQASLDDTLAPQASLDDRLAPQASLDDRLAPQASLVRIDFDVMAETLKRSVIGDLHPGTRVNLERAARVDSRLDGHVVQGHVDGTGTVLSRTPGDRWESVRFGLPRDLARFVAEKGSIAVSGVSLTVSAVGDDWFEVGLIPETLRATTLGDKQPGDPVNLEVDVLAKYVARLIGSRPTEVDR